MFIGHLLRARDYTNGFSCLTSINSGLNTMKGGGLSPLNIRQNKWDRGKINCPRTAASKRINKNRNPDNIKPGPLAYNHLDIPPPNKQQACSFLFHLTTPQILSEPSGIPGLLLPFYEASISALFRHSSSKVFLRSYSFPSIGCSLVWYLPLKCVQSSTHGPTITKLPKIIPFHCTDINLLVSSLRLH